MATTPTPQGRQTGRQTGRSASPGDAQPGFDRIVRQAQNLLDVPNVGWFEYAGALVHPFFTTKPAGEGTGLGLWLSFDIIVRQHGDQAAVDSQIDSFTEFTVTLPRRMAEGVSP
jgi:hypothetical protein